MDCRSAAFWEDAQIAEKGDVILEAATLRSNRNPNIPPPTHIDAKKGR